MYFCLDKTKLTAKGVTMAAQRRLTHEMYKSCLHDGISVRLPNTRIQSRNHALETVTTNKVSLSAFDDKRWIAANRIETLPYGHYSLKPLDDSFFDKIVDDSWESCDDWGDELEWDDNWERSVSPNKSFVFSSSEPSAGEFDQTQDKYIPTSDVSFNEFVQNEETVLERELVVLSSSLEFGGLSPIFSPDPGFYQREYSESELEDVVDLRNLPSDDSGSDPEVNPFLDLEARESPVRSRQSSSEPSPVIQRKRRRVYNPIDSD